MSESPVPGYRICTRCVMDTAADPDITFGAEGLCHHCERYDRLLPVRVQRGEAGRLALEALVTRIKAAGRGREYDCIIGVSGGVDSTYVAHLVVEHGLRPLARFVNFAVAGVDPDIMGVGPLKAVPKALARAGMSMDDLDLIEFNEAFAAQVLAVMRELKMPEDKVNVNGGAIALGHPLGATGAKLTTQLVHELARRGGGHGLVTMCIGGGMGAAGIFEVYPAAA